MKKTTVLLATTLLSNFAMADPFKVYQIENNAQQKEISVFTREMNAVYHRSLQKQDTPVSYFGDEFLPVRPPGASTWKHVVFHSYRWSKDKPAIGIASYTLYESNKKAVVFDSGHMVFEKLPSGKVNSVTWTHKGDSKRALSSELAQAGDIASTIPQLALEMNPVINAVGLWPVAVLKLVIPTVVKEKGSFPSCVAIRNDFQDMGWFATANNLAVPVIGMAAPIVGAIAMSISANNHNGFWECLPKDLR